MVRFPLPKLVLVRLPRRHRRPSRSAEHVTVGLAVMAIATAGTVIVGEVSRLARRRREIRQRADARQSRRGRGPATLDAAAVVRNAYSEAPRRETVLFNILSGFLGAFASCASRPGRSGAGGGPSGATSVGGRHIHHFVPGILLPSLAAAPPW